MTLVTAAVLNEEDGIIVPPRDVSRTYGTKSLSFRGYIKDGGTLDPPAGISKGTLDPHSGMSKETLDPSAGMSPQDILPLTPPISDPTVNTGDLFNVTYIDNIPEFIPKVPRVPSRRASGYATPVTRYSILVVDDSKLNRKMSVKGLLKCGSHVCEEAEDGVEAVDMVRKKMLSGPGVLGMLSESSGLGVSGGLSVSGGLGVPGGLGGECIYHAILMDFMMPNMDGPTATKQIRDMGYTGVIIGVTGNALPSDVLQFLTSGADRVLLKPMDMDMLQSTLLSYLNI